MKKAMLVRTKITLQDVASRLNVTKVTVSKALREHPDISEETRERVKKTAAEMGYIPNLAARNLTSHKTRTIGVIVPKVAHSFYPALVDSIYKYSAAHNYEIILTVSQEDCELERKHLTTMLAMKVDGIIVAVTNNTRDTNLFDIPAKYQIPLVQLDRTISDKFTRIVFDDFHGTYDAVSYAIGKGYRNIAFVGGNHYLHVGKERLDGFLKASREAGIEVDKSRILEGGFTEQVGYDALMKFHNEGKVPRFIFAVTYPIALGIYKAARELKLSIPDDLDLISFGDSFFNDYLSPPINCIYQDTDKMGKSAIEEVIYAIENTKTYKSKTIVLKSEIRYNNRQ